MCPVFIQQTLCRRKMNIWKAFDANVSEHSRPGAQEEMQGWSRSLLKHMMHCWNVSLCLEPSMGLAWSSEVKFQIRTCCSHAWNCHQLWLCEHHMRGGLRGQSYLDITSTLKYYGRWLFCFPLILSSKGLAQLWLRATGQAGIFWSAQTLLETEEDIWAGLGDSFPCV